VETYFARQARQRPLDRVQHELVVGSLLGDGTLLKTTSGWCFRVHHGLKQRSYVDFKHQFLREYVQSQPRQSGRAYYFRTITHAAFSDYRERFYQGNRKVIPIDLLREQLTGLGLAIWLMDDGSADGEAVRLNTQSFSRTENEALALLLRTKFGLDVRLNRDKGAFRLRIAAASKTRLIEVVRPYMHPDMSYKLSL
jgi:LAGLIDADG DNA endonuclease family